MKTLRVRSALARRLQAYDLSRMIAGVLLDGGRRVTG